MTESRAAVLYCPYCGEEELRPSEAVAGSWECCACTRVFRVAWVGLRRQEAVR